MGFTLNQMFQDKADRVNANQDSVRFKNAFIRSAQDALLSLNNESGTSATVVTDVDEDTGLEVTLYTYVSTGIDYYLTLRSEWKVREKTDRELLVDWERAKALASTVSFRASPPSGAHGAAAV